MAYIYSTLSNDQQFTVWNTDEDGKRLPIIQRQILINGKANIANKKTLITPKGIITKVTEEELGQLQRVSAFCSHVKDGFISIEHDKKEVEEVVKNMKGKDKSAQPTAADYEKKGHKVAKNK